jgi:hypothetical protein
MVRILLPSRGAGFGENAVVDFNTHKDVLQFNHALIANFAAAMADTKQMGLNTVITVDQNDAVTLQNVNMHSLASSNFHFS